MDKTDKNAIALLKKYPNAKFSIGETYDSLNWKDEETNKPTEQEFNTTLEDYDSKQYQRDRASAYPSTADQLDMLYHQGIEGWKAEIQKVKDQFPKPEPT